ncbi:hypothetical protein [Thermotoga caldifontis]|uniref:hypothetical protein n=1 Tax=Thermotoga caldifontis TaxID=1508419 RepID=UPI000597B8E9|nr:hypothetical protein [Thermotoga caldifontis]
MLAVLVHGVCPGVEVLLEGLKREGLNLAEIDERAVFSQNISSRQTLKETIDVLHKLRARKVLFIGNDGLLQLSYGVCSTGFQVAYVPSADSSLAGKAMGTSTVARFLSHLLTLSKEMRHCNTVKVLLPIGLRNLLSKLPSFLESIDEDEGCSLLVPGSQVKESRIDLREFLNCLDIDERERQHLQTLARNLCEAFTKWKKVHHVFCFDEEPVPISKVYELWKKVKEDEGSSSVREVGDQEYRKLHSGWKDG